MRPSANIKATSMQDMMPVMRSTSRAPASSAITPSGGVECNICHAGCTFLPPAQQAACHALCDITLC